MGLISNKPSYAEGIWVSVKNAMPPTKTVIDVITTDERLNLVNNRFTDVIYTRKKFLTYHLDIEIKGVTHWMIPKYP